MSNATLFQEGLPRRRNPKRRPKLRQHRGRNKVNIGTAATTTTTSVMLPPPSTTSTTSSRQKSGTDTISNIRKLFLRIRIRIRIRPPLFLLPPPLIRRRVRFRSRSIPIPRRRRREGRLLSNTARSGSWSQGWSSGEQSKIKTGSTISRNQRLFYLF